MEQKTVKPAKSNNNDKPSAVLSKIKRAQDRKNTEVFKKTYRQFYDDVKISDREDW